MLFGFKGYRLFCAMNNCQWFLRLMKQSVICYLFSFHHLLSTLHPYCSWRRLLHWSKQQNCYSLFISGVSREPRHALWAFVLHIISGCWIQTYCYFSCSRTPSPRSIRSSLVIRTDVSDQGRTFTHRGEVNHYCSLKALFRQRLQSYKTLFRENKKIEDEIDTWKDSKQKKNKPDTAEYVIMILEEERLFRLIVPFCLGF